MNPLLEASIKITTVIGLGLVASMLLRRRPAALRHWVLATAVAAALATPALMGLGPSWTLPVAARAEGQAPEPLVTPARDARVSVTMGVDSAQEMTASSAPSADPATILLTIWIAGVALNLLGLLVGFWRLHRTAGRAIEVRDGPWADAARQLSEHFGIRTPVRLLQSDQPALLVTWGVFRPKVLLPLDVVLWHADRIRIVLAHELAHVRRRDWVVQIGSELLRIVCWFNPLVWLASSRLRLESECACDDAVVNLGVCGREYATHLLDLARQFAQVRQVPLPAVAILPRSSSLERRVTAMLNARLSRGPVSRTTRLVTLAALVAVALPIVLFAQTTFATLSGSVADPSGGLLPGATVVATDTTRGAHHQVLTNRTGQFEIIGLPEGPHVLTVTLPGFQTFQQNLTLDGQDVTRNIVLRIGSLQETISVTRGGALPSFEGQRFSPKPAACGASGGRGGTGTATVRIGGQIKQPSKIRHVSPVYPESAAPGNVLMEAVIGPDGLVSDVKVLRNPAPALALSAENAVRQWEFTPTLLNCVPVPVIMTVTVDFN